VGINWIRWSTRALLGEYEDLSYITDTWLAELERSGVEVSAESSSRTDDDHTLYGCRLVDAVKYVAFEMKGSDEGQSGGETRIAWLEKPVEIVGVERPVDGPPVYAVRRASLPPQWVPSARLLRLQA
jgi:hypothetical protein